MLSFGFSIKVVNLISQCYSTDSLSILLNGSICGSVKAERGLRQGDPLSPFLFIILLELLSRMLFRLEEEDKIQGIKLGRNSPAISHLFFADDLMLFFRANEENVSKIAECLNQFCKWTGQMISVSKSGYVFSKNTKAGAKAQIKFLLNMKELQRDTKYLGNPLFLNKNKNVAFAGLFSKLERKLEGWKAKLLSQVGRCTLIKIVISSTPIYTMSANKLPFLWSRKVDKMACKFFWIGGSMKDRFWIPVFWDTICRPKFGGRLGLRRLEDINEVMLCKIG